MSLRVVVFDLDDTLYLERSYVESGFRAAAGWVERATGRSGLFAEAWALFERGERVDVLDRAVAALGLGDHAAIGAGAVEAYRTHRPTIELLPEARSAIEWCRARSEALALLTDGRSASQRAKIDALSLASEFDVIVVTDELGGRDFWKPSPAGFEVIEERLGASGRELVYIADNPVKDFVAPHRLGWRSVRVARAGGLYTPVAADRVVDDAEQVVDDLGALERGALDDYLLA